MPNTLIDLAVVEAQPCATLRPHTERVERIAAGLALLRASSSMGPSSPPSPVLSLWNRTIWVRPGQGMSINER